MTATANSAKKVNVFNEVNEYSYEPYPRILLEDENFSSTPWSEWNDAELNAEGWEEKKIKSAPDVVSKKEITPELFEDFRAPELPSVIKRNVHSFKRPHEVFSGVNLTVYDPSNIEFELSVPSIECDFLRYFNELLPILQLYAIRYGFPVELESQTFVPTTQGEPWRPWHHIYALCKAGKGQVHKPLYNPFGKYILRLFYMGSWRRFTVDDKIPCDLKGNCLLPVTQIRGELWPILLAKGLLKIISIYSKINVSLTDFPFLSSFTGWITTSISTLNKTSEQVWRRFLVLLPQYEISGEETELTISAKDLAPKTGSSKKGSFKGLEKKSEAFKSFCFVLAFLKNLPEGKDLLRNHQIAILRSRDTPLIKCDKQEPTKPWKKVRWIYWASKKGLWTDESLLLPYRRLQHISFIKELNELLAPDSDQEAAVSETVTDNEINFEDQPSKLYGDPEQWSDFFKFIEYLDSLNISFKPSFFPFTFRVTCLKYKLVEKTGSRLESAKTAIKLPISNVFHLTPNLTTSQNEPLLLFCESVTGIFLSISLWVSPQKPKNYPEYLDPVQPGLLKICHAHLIVERFDWRVIQQGEIIGIIKTVGNSSIFLNLTPGRHVLKLWLTSDSPYVMDVLSSVSLNIYKGPKIRFLMTNESERIIDYINVVSNAFISLCQKFGKPDFFNSLRSFYTAILPGNQKAVGYLKHLDEFIETFLYCILLSVKNLILNVEETRIIVSALKSLFINPKLRCDLPKAPSSIYGMGGKKTAKKFVPIIKERTLSQILNYKWSSEEINQIINIQRIFRGYRVRLLFKCQTPARKEFKVYTERLKKVCETIFTPAKREVEVGKIIRKIVMTNPELLTTFKFHSDFPNVIQLDEFSGKINNVEPYAWVPITRFIIACHGEDPVPCAFYLSCNLEQFVVLGVDNDTNLEIFRLTNSVSSHHYQSNSKGYTIFVFGWNEANVKTVNWRIEMVQMKYFQVIHLCNTMLGAKCHPYVMPALEVLEIKNFYVPNRNFRVCRCIIKVRKRTILTLRLSLSYGDVQFVVIISLDKKFCGSYGESMYMSDTVLTRATSTSGAVLLPSVVLENIEPNSWWGESNPGGDFTQYVLEAFVLNNSWPLTKHEWGIVEAIRVNGDSWKDSLTSLQSKRGLESKKKLTRLSKRSLQEQRSVESPFWMIQALNDFSESGETGDKMIFEEDTSYAESIKTMKNSWEEKNPGRRKKGREMRYNFLKMIFLENKKNESDFEGVFEEQEKDSDKDDELIDDHSFKVLLKQITSFSYLTADTSSDRLLNSPRILPQMPTQEMLNKYKRCTLYSSTDSSPSQKMSDLSSKFQNLKDATEDDKFDFLSQYFNYRLIILGYIDQERKVSCKLMEQAYSCRQKAIERLTR